MGEVALHAEAPPLNQAARNSMRNYAKAYVRVRPKKHVQRD